MMNNTKMSMMAMVMKTKIWIRLTLPLTLHRVDLVVLFYGSRFVYRS